MSVAVQKITYPYITTHPGIGGGSPLVEGTRITVWTIAGYYQMGMSVDEILNTLTHLNASQAHSALAYYFDHQQEIDEELKENGDIERWRSLVQGHPLPQDPS